MFNHSVIYWNIQPNNRLFFLLCVCVNVLACNSTSTTQNNKRESFPQVDSVIDLATKRGTGYNVNSIEFVDSALVNAELNIKEQIRILAYKAYVYNYYVGKVDSAKIYADSMTNILKNESQKKYVPEFTSTYFVNGDVLYKKKQYSEAYSYYYKARQLGYEWLDACAKKEYSYRVGLILYRQTRFNESKNYFIESYNHGQSCTIGDFNNYFRNQEILNNTALCYLKIAQYDSALYYFNAALTLIQKNQNNFTDRANFHTIAKGVIYGNMGEVMRIKGNYLKAESLFKQSVAINSITGYDVKDAQLSYLKLADLYLFQNKLDSAFIALQAIQQSLATIDHPRAVVEWNKLMWKYFDALNNKSKSYTYLSKYVQSNEAFINANKSINEVDVNKQLDIFNKQHELQQLQKDNELKQLYLVLVIVFVIMVLIIALLLWYNWNKSTKNVLQLQQLNETIHAQNNQLEFALNKLEESSREKDKIVKLVAHDLRTPVASISSLAELIIEEKDEPSRIEMLQVVKAACGNSLNLISEILETAGIKDKTVEKIPFSANTFLNNCAALLHISVADKGLQLIVITLPADVDVCMNVEKMSRVIYNLVNNALKFSNKGSTIYLKANIEQENLLLQVKDQGIGIPKKMHSKVFDVVTDIKRTGTDGEQSFGLGLSICKQIVEAHKGSIWFESIEQKGTTFYVSIPLVQ
jgi:signal transduction histidine kinase